MELNNGCFEKSIVLAVDNCHGFTTEYFNVHAFISIGDNVQSIDFQLRCHCHVIVHVIFAGVIPVFFSVYPLIFCSVMFHSDEAWFGFTNFARQRVWVIFALAKFVFFAAKELIRMNNNYLEKYILLRNACEWQVRYH